MTVLLQSHLEEKVMVTMATQTGAGELRGHRHTGEDEPISREQLLEQRAVSGASLGIRTLVV